MKKYPKVFFKNNENEGVDITGYSISKNLVSLIYENPIENLSGFCICDKDGNIVFDGSDFIYRWDMGHGRNEIYYTNDSKYRQTEPFKDLSDIPENADPLTNEELTECVADLMLEISVSQLGL